MAPNDEGWLSGQRAARAQVENDRQTAFEAAVVGRILKFAGLGAQIAAYRRDAIERGLEGLSLVWFNETFRRFPVIMGAEKIPHVHELTVGHLFGPNFMRLPMMKEYQKLQIQLGVDDRDARTGLVFMWPHVPTAGTMILHNYPIEVHQMPDPSLRNERNTRIVRPFGNPVVVYVIDPLDEFLISVGKDWAEI